MKNWAPHIKNVPCKNTIYMQNILIVYLKQIYNYLFKVDNSQNNLDCSIRRSQVEKIFCPSVNAYICF